MKKFFGLFLIILLLGLSVSAQNQKAKYDEQAVLSYIRDLSTDAMMGRKSGHPGGVMGEEYVAAKFKQWGIEPAGDNGTYFQNFTVEYRNVGLGAALEIWTDKLHRDFEYGEDWRVQSYSGSGHFVAEVLFAGYGIHAPELGYDDYADVEVKGKMVLLTTGIPPAMKKKLSGAGEVELDARVKAARKMGAAGVLAFNRDTGTGRYFRLRLSRDSYDPSFVILSGESRIVDFIFKELPTDLRESFRKIDGEGKPNSFLTGTSIFVSVNAEFDPERPTRNVLGKITGSDPKLKQETVIIGGHLDHLGIHPLGDVYNGANDNASGSAVAMEIARIMKLNGTKLKRTVIFATWAAEEQGLLGSNYYCDHPTHPIQKTVTYINMDMVAHGSGKLSFRGVYYGPQIWEAVRPKLDKSMLDLVTTSRGGPGGSDHSPFLAKGVPAYNAGSMGNHLKYHHVRDDTDLVKPLVLKRVGEFVTQAVHILADDPRDFILPGREALYHLKYQNLVNFKTVNAERFIEHRKDVISGDVDVQLGLLEEQEGLSGDALRVDLINRLFSLQDRVKEIKGISLFNSGGKVAQDVNMGRLILVLGLQGIRSFRDNPDWVEILAAQGINYVLLDDFQPFLGENGELTDEGEDLFRSIQSGGLLAVLVRPSPVQARAFLGSAKKPVAVLMDQVPEKDCLELIKEKKSALGLIMDASENGAEYFQKLEKVRQEIGTAALMIVNHNCVWKEQGRGKFLQLIPEILKLEYDRSDFANVFSAAFLSLLDQLRNSQ